VRCWTGIPGAIALVCWTALVLDVAAASAATPPLYHSPNDDGVSEGVPVSLPAGGSQTLHLYLGIGTTASTSDPCLAGDGGEICGYRLRIGATGVGFQTFTPADPDTIFNLVSDQLDLTGGNFQTGDLGATKIGDLVIDAPAPGGEVQHVLGNFVTTQLTKETLDEPATIVVVPEPGGVLSLAVGSSLLLALGRERSRSTRPGRPGTRSADRSSR
jgi:hypothetical protein